MNRRVDQVQKQVVAFGRRFWHRVVDVIQTLYRPLRMSGGMSRNALDRAMRVTKTIVTTPHMRELLHNRHLHQAIYVCVFLFTEPCQECDLWKIQLCLIFILSADCYVRYLRILQSREK